MNNYLIDEIQLKRLKYIQSHIGTNDPKDDLETKLFMLICDIQRNIVKATEHA